MLDSTKTKWPTLNSGTDVVEHDFARTHGYLSPLQASLDNFREYSDLLGGSYGSKLPPKEQATQFMAVEACLSAGVPLNALENSLMKDFLHHLGARLPGARHLANYIPFIEKKEVRPSRLAYGAALDRRHDRNEFVSVFIWQVCNLPASWNQRVKNVVPYHSCNRRTARLPMCPLHDRSSGFSTRLGTPGMRSHSTRRRTALRASGLVSVSSTRKDRY